MVAVLDRVEAAGHAPTRGAMTKVTVEPITVTINGLSSEVGAGPHNELDDDCVVSLHDVGQARAVVLAYDLCGGPQRGPASSEARVPTPATLRATGSPVRPGQ